jgi:hypothetical protein
LEDDVKKDAAEVAWCVYQLAMRDDLLPRFAKADMPPLPPAPAAQPTPTQSQKKPVARPKRKNQRRRG